jgi:uncharacterized protein (DUF58 family)
MISNPVRGMVDLQSYNHSMTKIHLRQPVLPMLIAFVLGLQLMEPSRAWTILLFVFAGIFVSAYLWARSLAESLHVRRETRIGWIQIGGQIEERITLSNTSLFPAPWVEFHDQSTLPGFNANRTTAIRAGYFDIWNVAATCDQRGVFTLGDAKILSADPFGIFDVSIPASQQTSILVLPQIATLPELQISPAGSYGDGQPRRNASQQTIQASTVRAYSHGDSLRQIHWPTTARMNKVYVRLMESAPEGSWWILLDLDRRSLLGEGPESIEEQSVTLASSLANIGLRNRKSVGLISNGEDLDWLAPQKGEGQRWEIMETLATARPGTLPLASLLERMTSLLGKHHSLIVITASTSTDWLKSLLPLSKRGILPTVILFDAFTFGGIIPADHLAASLEQHGIKCHIIPRGVIKLPKSTPSTPDRWTWHTTPSGEIVPIRK